MNIGHAMSRDDVNRLMCFSGFSTNKYNKKCNGVLSHEIRKIRRHQMEWSLDMVWKMKSWCVKLLLAVIWSWRVIVVIMA